MIKDLYEIIVLMKQKYDKDISIYGEAFLLKSIENRCLTNVISNAAEYCSYLEKDSKEADAFYTTLHIDYSQFFRDPMTFALLEQNIFPNILSNKSKGEIRIWSAGCSNGQEAYSLAILLSDLADNIGKELRLRIFATDISEESLAVGRAGVYDQSLVQNVKMKQLNKYFIKNGKTYSIIPQLKQYIDFSTYDLLDQLTANPPGSIYGDFDIVMCSNVLIYYKPDVQISIIKKLQKATSSIGYLVTGEAEKTLLKNITKMQIITPHTAVFKNNIGG